MAVTFKFLIIVLGFTIDAISCLPTISPNDSEYIISAGTNFTLTCTSETPTTWTYPDENETSNPNVSIESYEDNNLYISKLTIASADDLSVGYYYCNETKHPSTYASLYLYVEDAEYLYVGREPLRVATGKQYSQLIIPCRPTSPNIDVKLYSGVSTDAEEELISTIEYDPKIGFVLDWSEISMQTPFSCKLSKGNISVDVLFLVDIPKVYTIIRQPIVRQLHDIVYNTEHEDLQLLCDLEVESGQEPKFTWKINGRTIVENHSKYLLNNTIINTSTALSVLIVRNIMIDQDQGNYSCHVTDGDNNAENSLQVTILQKGTHFLYLSESNDILEATCVKSCEPIVWNINVTSYPPAEITWIDNLNKNISNGTKYRITNTNKESILEINNVTVRDRGIFTIRAKNTVDDKSFTVFVDARGKPTVKLSNADFHIAGANEVVECEVSGYPTPKIEWQFKPCMDNDCEFEPIPSETTLHGVILKSEVVIRTNRSGYIKCTATNEYGTDEKTEGYIVTDVKGGFKIVIIEDEVELPYPYPESVKLAVEDTVTFQCVAASQNYSNKLQWYLNDTLMDTLESYSLESSTTIYSTKRSFTLNPVTVNNAGTYKCIAERKPRGDPEIKIINIKVVEPEAPNIIHTNMKEDKMVLIYPMKHNLSCLYDGIPRPSIVWLKDDLQFFPDNKRITYENNKQVLLFSTTTLTDEGKYTCRINNRLGFIERTAEIAFSNKPDDNRLAYIISGIVVALFLAVVIWLLIKTKKERKLRRMLKLAGLQNFEKGAIESINPELGIDDQAELLPYDKELWEIHREDIKLGSRDLLGGRYFYFQF